MKYNIFWFQSLGVNSTSLDPNTVRLLKNYLTISQNLQNEQRIYVDCNNQHLSTIQGGAR